MMFLRGNLSLVFFKRLLFDIDNLLILISINEDLLNCSLIRRFGVLQVLLIRADILIAFLNRSVYPFIILAVQAGQQNGVAV